MRGIEFGAAGLVLLFGLGLLFGYLAAERATCSRDSIELAASLAAVHPMTARGGSLSAS